MTTILNKAINLVVGAKPDTTSQEQGVVVAQQQQAKQQAAYPDMEQSTTVSKEAPVSSVQEWNTATAKAWFADPKHSADKYGRPTGYTTPSGQKVTIPQGVYTAKVGTTPQSEGTYTNQAGNPISRLQAGMSGNIDTAAKTHEVFITQAKEINTAKAIGTMIQSPTAVFASQAVAQRGADISSSSFNRLTPQASVLTQLPSSNMDKVDRPSVTQQTQIPTVSGQFYTPSLTQQVPNMPSVSGQFYTPAIQNVSPLASHIITTSAPMQVGSQAFAARTKSFATYPIATGGMAISSALQSGVGSVLGYNERSDIQIKAAYGAASAITSLPSFVGQSVLAGEGIARYPREALTGLPKGFGILSSSITQQAASHPIEFGGSLVGMVATSKAISMIPTPKISKISSAFSDIQGIKTIKTYNAAVAERGQPWIGTTKSVGEYNQMVGESLSQRGTFKQVLGAKIGALKPVTEKTFITVKATTSEAYNNMYAEKPVSMTISSGISKLTYSGKNVMAPISSEAPNLKIYNKLVAEKTPGWIKQTIEPANKPKATEFATGQIKSVLPKPQTGIVSSKYVNLEDYALVSGQRLSPALRAVTRNVRYSPRIRSSESGIRATTRSALMERGASGFRMVPGFVYNPTTNSNKPSTMHKQSNIPSTIAMQHHASVLSNATSNINKQGMHITSITGLVTGQTMSQMSGQTNITSTTQGNIQSQITGQVQEQIQQQITKQIQRQIPTQITRQEFKYDKPNITNLPSFNFGNTTPQVIKRKKGRKGKSRSYVTALGGKTFGQMLDKGTTTSKAYKSMQNSINKRKK